MTHSNAVNYCNSIGRFLVVPRNRVETNEIRGLLPDGDVRAWLGIQKVNGRWTSDDPNNNLTWYDWGPCGEGNQEEPNAGMVWESGEWNGEWYDMHPGARVHYAVCVKENFVYGIKDGEPSSEVTIIGSCAGRESGSYLCEGVDNFIKWNIDLGESDFRVQSDFKAAKVEGTALTFILWAGDTQYRIGLDGANNSLFYEGGAWGEQATLLGSTPLDPDNIQTLVITRTGNSLLVVFDGNAWTELNINESIDAVGWRPWRNTIRVRNLMIQNSSA